MIDPVDHCAEAARLRKILTQIADGSLANSVRFGEDEVRYAKADKDELKLQLAFHEDQCAASQGIRLKRRRYGMVGRARPY